MGKLKSLKLTQISQAELEKKEMDLLLGGYGPCYCGCWGSSSTHSNGTANSSNGYGGSGDGNGNCRCACGGYEISSIGGYAAAY